MNKDVIYIEPEDDITDIVTKIENSKEQIVAIIPPKKADILHSSINVKLIDKAGKNADKKIVLVTTDTVVIKHAASIKMPITKDLQTAPVVPSIESEDEPEEESENGEVVEEKAETIEEDEDDGLLTDESDKAIAEKVANKEESEESKEEVGKGKKKNKKEKKAKKEKAEKPDKNPTKVGAWFKKHRKAFFIGTPILLALIAVMVWAFVIAPAVEIEVTILTKPKDFKENITFTTNPEEENIEIGKFYLEEKKVESPSSAKFTATGKKNVGEKAKGNVIVYKYFRSSGAVAINANSTFSTNNLTFYSDEDVTFGWDGNNLAECGNNGDSSIVTYGCLIFTRINVTAAAPGSDYNIAPTVAEKWSTTADVAVYTDTAMAGGTDRTITVVQESDINAAKANLTTGKNDETKAALFDGIKEESFPIEASFKQTTAEVVSVPALGEEVPEGVEPSLSTTTTATIYVVDRAKINDFIIKKAPISEDKRVYAVGKPFVEGFTNIESGFTGILKTSFTYGLKLTEESIIETVKGARLGNVKNLLPEDAKPSIKTSYPWVTSVPNDVNKITVTIKEE